MYKWHVNSAIGRGRPLAHDIARVTEGIAASLRAFSGSAMRCAEDDGPANRNSRAERSSNAASDISSLPRHPSRGIDARSLAARPPPQQGFTISRQSLGFAGGRGGVSSFRGRSGPGGAFRGTFRGRGRGGGTARGRGRGRGGRGRGGRKPRPPKKEDLEQDEYDPPYNEAERLYEESQESGEYVPFNPSTSLLEELQTMGSGMPTSGTSWGFREAIHNKMAAASGTLAQKEIPVPAERHFRNMEVRSRLGTVFASREEKEKLRAWRDGVEDAVDDIRWKIHKTYEIEGLRDKEKEVMLKEMVAGVYEGPKDVKEGMLGLAEKYARKNETFLPEDERSLEKRLQSLLPEEYLPKAKSKPQLS